MFLMLFVEPKISWWYRFILLFKKKWLQYIILFQIIYLEEKITEEIPKRISWPLKVSKGIQKVFRALQTSDSWGQRRKNVREKTLITHVILDRNWILTTRWKPRVLFLGVLGTFPRAIRWKTFSFLLVYLARMNGIQRL